MAEAEGVSALGDAGRVGQAGRALQTAAAGDLATSAPRAAVAPLRQEEAGASGSATPSGGIFGARGPTSGRPFDPAKAGGPIGKLSTVGVRITHAGIDVVQQHVARFGPDEANSHMISRLQQIASGRIEATPYDVNFYTHEIRESQRYANLGFPTGQPAGQDAAYELWNNAHTATLEDYGLKDGQLYHPDALK